MDNAGVLTASGLIAGEALCGIAVAAVIARRLAHDPHAKTELYHLAIGDSPVTSLIALAALVAVMILVPLANAGQPEIRRLRLRLCSAPTAKDTREHEGNVDPPSWHFVSFVV